MNKIKEFGKAVLIIILFFIGYNLLFLGLYLTLNFFVDVNEKIIDFFCTLCASSLLFLYYKKVLLKDLKKFKTSFMLIFKKYFKYYLFGILVMAVSNSILFSLTSSLATNEELNRQMLTNFPLFSAITVCVFAPFYEEVLFRLGFKKVFNNKFIYCLITGIIFGAMHLLTATSFIELLYLIPYSSIGIALGFIYFDSDNIFSSIMFHMINNSFSVFILLLGGM